MSITKYISLLLAAVTTILATGCDNIDESNRYINVGKIEAKRAVLLEDFTGQDCLNCPAAHETIEQLTAQYGADKVIAVSIHAGIFGFPVKRTNFSEGRVGLMTDEGNALLQAYGINSFPMGVVDMGQPITFDLWGSAVDAELEKPSAIELSLEAGFNPDGTELPEGYSGDIEIECKVLSATPFAGNIQFWIVENKIVARQKNGSVMINDYVHNNVFRAQVFDGLRGKSLLLPGGLEQTVSGKIATRWTEREHWEMRNVDVVAFVSGNDGVEQAARTSVRLLE